MTNDYRADDDLEEIDLEAGQVINVVQPDGDAEELVSYVSFVEKHIIENVFVQILRNANFCMHGVHTVIWLGQGLENDHTDGHVDDITCFARPGAVITATCDDPADFNYRVLNDNIDRLRQARDAKGRSLEIIPLPLPARRETAAGRLVLTYVNFYLANGAVIMPSFDDPMDGQAAEILARAFPDRAIVQVSALDILEGGGGIHCITQQQPAGRPAALEGT